MFKNILLVFNPNSSSLVHNNEWTGKVISYLNPHISGFIAIKKIGETFQSSSIFDDINFELDLVIAAGGDGTIRKVISDIYNYNPMLNLAVLPLGTGNQLARNLKIFEDSIISDPLETSLRNITSGKAKKIDIGIMNQQIFSVACGVGPLSDAILVPDSNDKATWKMLAYFSSVIGKLSVDPINFKISIDDLEPFEIVASGVFISNVGDLGIGKLSTTSSVEDGLLDICILTPHNFAQYIELGFNFVTGFVGSTSPYYLKKASMIKIDVIEQSKKKSFFSDASKKIKSLLHLKNTDIDVSIDCAICMIDGDEYGYTPMEVSIIPKAVNIICPIQDE